MQTSDPEFDSEDKDDVVITDLDMPTRSGQVPKEPASGRKVQVLRVRSRMSIAIVIATFLLVFTVLVGVLHVPQVQKTLIRTVQINYPVALTVSNGVCYATAPDGVVSAIRVKDGLLLWRHQGVSSGEQSITVVDGVLFLTPILPYHSTVTRPAVQALRARDGSKLWSRTFPTDSPQTFQLTAVSGIVYIWSASDRIDAVRASNGTSLWHYTSQTSFNTMPIVADGVVYTGTQDGHFTALRADDGILLWTYTSNSPPMPFPEVIAEGMVFLNLRDGSMDVIRIDTGLLRWRYIPRVPAQKISTNILVADGVVYMSTQDGHLLALHASNGYVVWSVIPNPGDNLYLMNITADLVIVVAFNSGSIDAIRESSGSVIWDYPNRAGESVPITVIQGVVYLASYTTGANVLVNLSALQASDGKLIWNYTPRTSYRQLLPVDGNDIVLLALQDGSVEALHASSGSLLWQRASNS